jgi:hypothetical protein
MEPLLSAVVTLRFPSLSAAMGLPRPEPASDVCPRSICRFHRRAGANGNLLIIGANKPGTSAALAIAIANAFVCARAEARGHHSDIRDSSGSGVKVIVAVLSDPQRGAHRRGAT